MGKYYVLLVLTCLFWAGSFVVSKALVGQVTPMSLTMLRWALVVICLCPFVIGNKERRYVPKKAILPLFCMGVTGVVLFNIFQYVAIANTSATNVGFIATLNMASIAICSALFLKERVSFYQILMMCMAFFGVMLVVAKGSLLAILHLELQRGDLWMLLAVMIWGLYTVCSRWAMRYTNATTATCYSGMIGLVILGPFSMNDWQALSLTATGWLGVLYIGIMATVVCTLLWTICVEKVGATTAGVFINFDAIFTALLAFIFLGESITWMQGTGCFIAISACIGFAYFEKKRALCPKFQTI